MKTPAISKNNRRGWLPYAVISLLVVALYGNTLKLEYALDDYLVITGNAFTKQGISGIPDILVNDSFTGFFGKQKNLVAGGRYRPLSQITFAIEYELFGLNPLIGHLLNLLLYLLLGLCTYKVLEKLLGSGKNPRFTYLPLIGTLLFLAHPIHTEAVANIKGRDEILSMLGSMSAWLFTIRYLESRKMGDLIGSGILFFLALMSKENAITFLAVIPLGIYFFSKSSKPILYIRALTPMAVATIAFLALRFNALGFFMGGAVGNELLNNPYILASGEQRHATNIYTWGRYLKLLFWPHPLTHDYYPFHIAYKSFSDAVVLISLAAIVGIIALAIWLFRSKHLVSFAILFFVATFSISSNVVFNIGTFMNERFLFVPSLGFALVLSWVLLRMLGSQKNTGQIWVFIIPILLLYSAKTISRNPAWQNDYTLFTTDVKVSSNSVKCLISAGGKTMEKYEALPENARNIQMIDQAIVWLDKGVRIHPKYFAGWEQLGKGYFLKENFEAAWHCYEQCLKINPNSQTTVDNLILIARAASFRKDYTLASKLWGILFERMPENASVATQYADALALSGRAQEGLTVVNKSLLLSPDDYLLWGKKGELWGRYLNRLDSSEVFLKRSLALNPQYTAGLENLGVVYGMTGRSNESLELLLKALDTDPKNPRILTNIANTYMILGKKAEADLYLARAAAVEAEAR